MVNKKATIAGDPARFMIDNIMFRASEAVHASSGEQVLQNFVDMLKRSNPKLKMAIAVLTPWTMLIAAILRYALIRRSLKAIMKYIKGILHTSVSIPSSHPLHSQVMAWLIDHGLGEGARTLTLANPQAGSMKQARSCRSVLDDLALSGIYRLRTRPTSEAEDNDVKSQGTLSFLPQVGKYHFWFNHRRMTFERRAAPSSARYSNRLTSDFSSSIDTCETIDISCLSLFAGAKPIKEFLDHVKASAMAFEESMTTIYRPDAGFWDVGITRPSRDLNAVTMDAALKQSLVTDVETYLKPQTRKFYANRGIPYRRGLLLYGPAGTGKTSFTTAVAGHFGLDVYLVSLSTNTLNDTLLASLFEQLPSKCVVLLEDIDSAGIKREHMKNPKPKTDKRRVRYDEYGRAVKEQDLDEGVTLSGLLNVLDGIYAVEGRITIMTSNNPESLDPALIRPGRIDRKIFFGCASKEVTAELFSRIFSKSSEELLEAESPSEHDIPRLAEQFATHVPADTLTPAEIQGYLLVNRADPIAAVKNVSDWVKNILETKVSEPNAASVISERSLISDESSKKAGPPVPASVLKMAAVPKNAVAPANDLSLDSEATAHALLNLKNFIGPPIFPPQDVDPRSLRPFRWEFPVGVSLPQATGSLNTRSPSPTESGSQSHSSPDKPSESRGKNLLGLA